MNTVIIRNVSFNIIEDSNEREYRTFCKFWSCINVNFLSLLAKVYAEITEIMPIDLLLIPDDNHYYMQY